MAYMRDKTGDRLDDMVVARRQDASEIPVLTRVQACSATGLSNGADAGRTYKIKHEVLRTTRRVRFAFGNFFNTGSGGETETPNDITVRFSVEDPATAARIPATFGGQRDITLKPGALAWTDWMYVPLVAGTPVYTYTYVSVAELGQKWPTYLLTHSARGEGSVASDATAAGNVSPGVFYAYTAHAAHGIAREASPAVALAGDSISVGTGDNQFGFLVRALVDNQATPVPYQRLGANGERMAQWRLPSWLRRRLLPSGTTHLICEYGINDFLYNSDLSTLQANMVGFWSETASQGIAVAQTTIGPATTSTDNWATVENQKHRTFEASRVALNNWLRDGAPLAPDGTPAAVGAAAASRAGDESHPLSVVFEVADHIETARNSGIWKVGHISNDGGGVHPNATGHAAMAQASSVGGEFPSFASWVTFETARA